MTAVPSKCLSKQARGGCCGRCLARRLRLTRSLVARTEATADPATQTPPLRPQRPPPQLQREPRGRAATAGYEPRRPPQLPTPLLPPRQPAVVTAVVVATVVRPSVRRSLGPATAACPPVAAGAAHAAAASACRPPYARDRRRARRLGRTRNQRVLPTTQRPRAPAAAPAPQVRQQTQAWLAEALVTVSAPAVEPQPTGPRLR
jgi:hypothetical protein